MKNLLIGLLLLCPLAVQAGLFDDDEARAQIAHLQKESDTRLQLLEVANRKMLDLVNQIAFMQNDLAKLKGQLEELTYGLENAQKRQRELYVDLDGRIQSLETAKMQEQVQSSNKTLNAMIANIRMGRYKPAIGSLKNFIASHSLPDQLGAAYYWLGMSYSGIKNFVEAKVALQKVITEYADNSHVPDALLALASIHASQGEKAASTQTLHTLVERYPQSSAAQQAKKALVVLE